MTRKDGRNGPKTAGKRSPKTVAKTAPSTVKERQKNLTENALEDERHANAVKTVQMLQTTIVFAGAGARAMALCYLATAAQLIQALQYVAGRLRAALSAVFCVWS